MRKNFAQWLFFSTVILFFLPWLTVAFVKSDAGMMACFMLLYIINPLFMVITGIISGQEMKRKWYYPIVSAGVFFCGAWLILDMEETAFLYGGTYLLFGGASMLISYFISRIIHKQIQEVNHENRE